MHFEFVEDAQNPNNRRLMVDGSQWAKVYGFSPEVAEARARIIANALEAWIEDNLK